MIVEVSCSMHAKGKVKLKLAYCSHINAGKHGECSWQNNSTMCFIRNFVQAWCCMALNVLV